MLLDSETLVHTRLEPSLLYTPASRCLEPSRASNIRSVDWWWWGAWRHLNVYHEWRASERMGPISLIGQLGIYISTGACTSPPSEKGFMCASLVSLFPLYFWYTYSSALRVLTGALCRPCLHRWDSFTFPLNWGGPPRRGLLQFWLHTDSPWRISR